MKQTIAQKIDNDMAREGFTLAGKTSGQPTTRRGSNLNRLVVRLNLLDAYLIEKKMESDGLQVERTILIMRGAKQQRATEGTDLFVYTKARGESHA